MRTDRYRATRDINPFRLHPRERRPSRRRATPKPFAEALVVFALVALEMAAALAVAAVFTTIAGPFS